MGEPEEQGDAGRTPGIVIEKLSKEFYEIRQTASGEKIIRPMRLSLTRVEITERTIWITVLAVIVLLAYFGGDVDFALRLLSLLKGG